MSQRLRRTAAGRTRARGAAEARGRVRGDRYRAWRPKSVPSAVRLAQTQAAARRLRLGHAVAVAHTPCCAPTPCGAFAPWRGGLSRSHTPPRLRWLARCAAEGRVRRRHVWRTQSAFGGPRAWRPAGCGTRSGCARELLPPTARPAPGRRGPRRRRRGALPAHPRLPRARPPEENPAAPAAEAPAATRKQAAAAPGSAAQRQRGAARRRQSAGSCATRLRGLRATRAAFCALWRRASCTRGVSKPRRARGHRAACFDAERRGHDVANLSDDVMAPATDETVARFRHDTHHAGGPAP